jgi:hypothetical protein
MASELVLVAALIDTQIAGGITASLDADGKADIAPTVREHSRGQ